MMTKILVIFFLCFFYSSALFAYKVKPPKESINSITTRVKNVVWDQATSEHVEIDASLDQVWDYLSQDQNAKDWSIFFSHITTYKVPGNANYNNEVIGAGAMRRCFRDAQEKTMSWDEMLTLIETEQNKKIRHIYTYNLYNFPMQFLLTETKYFVRQVYQKISDQKIILTFQTTIDPKSNWISHVFFKLNQREVKRIFKANLENIKAGVEGKPRPNPHEAFPNGIIEKALSLTL